MNTSVIGLLVAVALIVVIWFVFVAPSERRYHERKLELMQERIEKRKQHLKEEKARRDGADATSVIDADSDS